MIRIIHEKNEEIQKLVRDALEGTYLEEEEGEDLKRHRLTLVGSAHVPASPERA